MPFIIFVGITCGTLQGSFAVQFGDHFPAGDHLRSGSLAALYSTTWNTRPACVRKQSTLFLSQVSRVRKSLRSEHGTSSPTYPQSNRKAKNAVRTAKSLLEKVAGWDPYLLFLDWRNTPSETLNSKR